MQKKFGYKNVMEIPKLDKIVINMGVGEAKENAKALESAVKDLETIIPPLVGNQGIAYWRKPIEKAKSGLSGSAILKTAISMSNS